MTKNQERINPNSEKVSSNEALENAGIEQREKLRKQIEKGNDQTLENVDEARNEALEKARSSLETKKTSENNQQELSKERRPDGPIGQSERDASFKATMKEVQSQMSAPSKAFSKVIHNKVVEKVSEGVGTTIARPNALLAGALSAFVLTLTIYLIAKELGYPLSGFESIGAFILGWLIGITYDFLKVMVTGRK